MEMGFVSGGNGKEDAQSRGSGGGIGEIPIIIYYDATYKTKTNADRIRAMTDEELAEFISGKARTFGEEYEGYMSALDWLKEETGNGRI